MPAADPPTTTIERELHVAARPETVFRYFVEPDRMVRWMGTTADLDPRPGGTFRVDYRGKDVASGTFREVDPPRRVVFTWGWEMPGDPVPPGASTVEVTLTPTDDGAGTLVRLVHRDLPGEAIAGHAEGWDFFLPTLATAAAAERWA